MPYEVLLDAEFSGATDGWTEYLCIEVLPDGQVELSSRSAEVLMRLGDEVDDVVWPDGYDPDDGEPDDDEPDDEILLVSVGGKRVAGWDGEYILGEKLVPHGDDATACFVKGETEEARAWLTSYGWSDREDFSKAWAIIEKALK